jgi:hypothetical protein
VHPEAAFLTGYALALVAVAAGLAALGRRSADPWASRVLAASRPPDIEPAEARATWLQSDVPTFHLCVSGVALAAAALLTVVSSVRHHRPTELAVQLTVLAAISLVGRRLVRHHAGEPGREVAASTPVDDGRRSALRRGAS